MKTHPLFTLFVFTLAFVTPFRADASACPHTPCVLDIPAPSASMFAPAWTGVGDPFNATVTAVVVDKQNNVYVAGIFGAAGSTSLNYVAKWDGAQWTSLGTGMNDWVYSLAVDTSGTVYAGGRFTTAGGVPATRVAAWNGVSWTPLGDGMNNPVEALVVGRNNILYAGGGFRLVGDASAYGIAQWNGQTWSYVGGGVNNTVYALAYDTTRGMLYAGGGITAAGAAGVSRVARWDGATWNAMGTGVDDYVYALAVDTSGAVYAGGDFVTSGGSTTLNHLGVWDGSDWIEVGGGVDDGVRSLAVDGDQTLYVGGRFLNAGAVSAARIAHWSGGVWQPLEGGMDSGEVDAIGITYGAGQATLFAAGNFSGIGGDTSLRWFAQWDGAYGLPTALEPIADPHRDFLSHAYPNPFDSRSVFSLTVDEAQEVTVHLYDVLGRQVATLFAGYVLPGSETLVEISGKALPAGAYIYEAIGRDFRESHAVTIVR